MTGEERRTKFDARREATRAELLELGAARFPVGGYAATSVDDVVRGSSHTKGAVYFHFGSKEGFFLEVMRFRGELMQAWWGGLAGREFASLADGLDAAAPWLDVTRGLPDSMLLAEFRFAMRDKPPMLNALSALYARWIDQLVPFVELLRSQGLTRTDLADREMAEAIYHVTDGYVVHSAIFGSSLGRLTPDLERLLRP